MHVFKVRVCGTAAGVRGAEGQDHACCAPRWHHHRARSHVDFRVVGVPCRAPHRAACLSVWLPRTGPMPDRRRKVLEFAAAQYKLLLACSTECRCRRAVEARHQHAVQVQCHASATPGSTAASSRRYLINMIKLHSHPNLFPLCRISSGQKNCNSATRARSDLFPVLDAQLSRCCVYCGTGKASNINLCVVRFRAWATRLPSAQAA